MTDEQLRLMMLDIDGILTHHHATTADVLTAAQQLAVSAIGDLVNKSDYIIPHPFEGRGANGGAGSSPQPSDISHQTSEALHSLADAIADQIRHALHARINEGHRPDW